MPLPTKCVFSPHMKCLCARGGMFEFASASLWPCSLPERLCALRAELCPFVSAPSAIPRSCLSWIRQLCVYLAMGHLTFCVEVLLLKLRKRYKK